MTGVRDRLLGDAAGTAVGWSDGSDATGLGVDRTGNRAGGWCDARRRGAMFNALLPLCCCLCYAFRVLPSIAVDGSAGMAAQYGWSNSEKGLFISAFYYGYVVLQIPGGWLASKLGGKTVALWVLVGSAAFTAATPTMASVSFGWGLVARVGSGLCQGALYPTWTAMVAVWLKQDEQGMARGLFSAGANAGIVVAFLGAPHVMSAVGWRWSFWLLALLAVPWVLLWLSIARSLPTTSPVLTAPSSINKHVVSDSGPVCAALSSPAMYGACFCAFTASWISYTLISFMPQYLEQRFNMDLSDAGSLAVLPYLIQIFTGVVGGRWTDQLIGRGNSVRAVRGGMSLFANMAPAILTAAAAVALSADLVTVCISAGVGLWGIGAATYQMVPLDLFPEHAGALFGIVNMVGNSAGFAAPYVAGIILDGGHCPSSSGKRAPHVELPASCVTAWHTVLYLSAAASAAGGVVFFVSLLVESRYRALQRRDWAAGAIQ